MNPTLHWLLWLLLAYLAGSIPFALLLGWLRSIDIREHGSGNVGASNLGRALGKAWGIGCFGLDVVKGLGPALGYGLAVGMVGGLNRGGVGPTLAWVAIAFAPMLGHVFTPWLKFQGGKGVATGLGALLGLYPLLTVAGVLAGGIWLAVIWFTGYVSLASVLAAAAVPVLTLVIGLVLGIAAGEVAVLAALTLLLAGLVIGRHRGNLARLRAGIEEKVTWAGR